MPTGAAGRDVDARSQRQFLVTDVHLFEINLARVERDAAHRGVANGARLLPDFLEHEVLVAALFRLNRIPENARHLALDGVAIKVGKHRPCARQHGHIAIGKKIDIARVLQNARHIRGHKSLVLTNAHNHRRARARNDDLVRLGGRKHTQRKGSREPLHGATNGLVKQNDFTGRGRILFDLLNQVRNDLGIRLGHKEVALRGQFALKLKIVFNDAVVHNDDRSGAVAVRMRILFGWATMRSPARMADAEGACQRMLAQNFFKVVQLSRRTRNVERFATGRAQRNARRIISAIFKVPQPLENHLRNIL